MSMPSGAYSSQGSRGGGPNDKIPKGYRAGQMQQFTPEQMELLQQMMDQVGPGSYLGRLAGGDQSMFEEMEAPAMKQFQGLQGDIASRFSGQGMGGRHGSGFSNTMNQATSDFAQNLQSQRMNMRNQAIQSLMGMSNNLLGQRPYEKFMTKKDQSQGGGWPAIAGGILGGAGGAYFGGPQGAMAGANAGYNVGSQF